MKKKVLVEEGRNSWSRMPPLPLLLLLLLLLPLVVGSPLRDDNSAAERSTMTTNHHRTIKTTTVGDCRRGRRIRSKEWRSDDDACPPRDCCGCFCCFRERGIVPSVCIVREGVVIGKECSCCRCAEDATMKRRDECMSGRVSHHRRPL